LSRLLSTEGMILPKKYVEAKGDDGFTRAPVGSGPYRFVEQVSGSHVRLEAVPSHWRLGTPKYKTVVFKAVPEETTRIAMLRRGEADVVEISRERMKEVEGAGYAVHLRREDGQIEGWFVQPWAQTPIRDKRVREALNLAIDRTELAETVFGGQASPAAVPFGLSWSFPEIKFKITGNDHDRPNGTAAGDARSEEHTSELQSRSELVCRLLLEKKKKIAIEINDE